MEVQDDSCVVPEGRVRLGQVGGSYRETCLSSPGGRRLESCPTEVTVARRKELLDRGGAQADGLSGGGAMEETPPDGELHSFCIESVAW